MNNYLITKAKQADSAEELLTVAEQRANELNNRLHTDNEISDDELEALRAVCLHSS